jgi:hypothetical protein
MILEFTKIKYYPLYLFFIFTLLMSFGVSRGLHYKIAPYFVLLSLLIIISSNQNIYKGVLKSLVIFAVITTISSINFIYFSQTKYSYIEYLSYSNSIYFASFVLYAFIIKRPESLSIIKLFIIVFFILGIYRYFRSEVLYFSVDDYQRQNNAFYYVLMPLPLIFLIKNRIIKSASLIIAFIICVLSIKRSAIIIISILSLVFIYFNFIKGRKKLRFLFFLIVAFTLLINMFDFSIISERFDLVLKRLDNLQEDGGSGRMAIIERFFEHDYKDILNFPNSLIGKGFLGYNAKYPNLAAFHNDWMEMFYSFGFIGLLNLIFFYVLMIRNLKMLIKQKSPMITGYLSAVLIFIFYSLTGGLFHFMYLSLTIFSFLGVTEAMFKNKINVL